MHLKNDVLSVRASGGSVYKVDPAKVSACTTTMFISRIQGLVIQCVCVWTARSGRAFEVAMLKDPLPLAQYCSLTI